MTNEEVKQQLMKIIDFNDPKSINTISRCITKYNDIYNHLKDIQTKFSLVSIMESVYLIINDMIEPKRCIDCHDKYTKFLGYHKGYKERCPKCALKHSAIVTHQILKNKTDEEKQEIIKRTQLKIKETRDNIKKKLENDNSWKTITRQEAKDYLVKYIGDAEMKIKGIGNHLLHKNPRLLNYINHESKKFGYNDNSVILYMILNDIETPPKCIDCNINYAAFYNINGKNQFSERCSKCGFKNGGVQADLSYCAKHGHSFFANLDLHKRISDERFERTGYHYPMQNPEVLAKSLKTVNENYGGTGFGSKTILNSINNTCKEKYNGKTIFELSGTKKFQDKVKNTCLEKYGETNWMKTDRYKKMYHNFFVTDNRIKEVKEFLLKYDLELVSEYSNALKPIVVKHIPCGRIIKLSSYCQLQQEIIVPQTVCKHCFPDYGNGKSYKETELQKYIESIDSSIIIERNDRKILPDKKELDLYLPDYNLAIEYCGLWCHSTNCDAYHSDLVKEPEYHYNKFKQCKDLGIRLITIFDNEDLQWYKNLIYKIITKTENYNLEDLNLYKEDNNTFYLLDNKTSSYDFFPLKDKFKLIKNIPYMANFWKYKECIREDEFIDKYLENLNTDVYQLAHDMKYNWVFDCGYQLLQLI